MKKFTGRNFVAALLRISCLLTQSLSDGSRTFENVSSSRTIFIIDVLEINLIFEILRLLNIPFKNTIPLNQKIISCPA